MVVVEREEEALAEDREAEIAGQLTQLQGARAARLHDTGEYDHQKDHYNPLEHWQSLT